MKQTEKNNGGDVNWIEEIIFKKKSVNHLEWSHRADEYKETLIWPRNWSQSWKTKQPWNDFLWSDLSKIRWCSSKLVTGLFCVCWLVPVVMSEQRSVTVPEIQTPDLHVPVSRTGGDDCAVLLKDKVIEVRVRQWNQFFTMCTNGRILVFLVLMFYLVYRSIQIFLFDYYHFC